LIGKQVERPGRATFNLFSEVIWTWMMEVGKDVLVWYLLPQKKRDVDQEVRI
jgi:hypothetical protein